MQTLSSGALLHNNTYRIIRVLGQGGFGITYLAIHVRLKKYVAIKEFFPKTLCNRDADTSQVRTATDANSELVGKLRKKFLKEAEHIAKMDSPYIVKIIDVFEENNTAYYIMDYIEGQSLSDLVKSNGPLPTEKAISYIIKVGEALSYIHSKKINHLDVKPANIMLRTSDNTPILVDFGLSKQYDSEGDQTSTTPVGISHGYAPMEQYKEGGVKEFSPQTDLYSLAATLYYLLTGVVPPQAPSMVDEDLSFPTQIPNWLHPIILQAMSSKRLHRQRNISVFCEQLKDVESTDNETQYDSNTDTIEANQTKSDRKMYETDKAFEYRKKLESLSKEERHTLINKNIQKAILYAIIVLCLYGFIKWLNTIPDNNTENDKYYIEYNVDGQISGHEYVDLGLPSGILWATRNLCDLDSINKTAMYFEWGETKPKDSSYISINTIESDDCFLKGISGTLQDASTSLWGKEWMLPTEEDFNELEQYCKMEWNESPKGMSFIGPNGKRVFLPAYGFKNNNDGNIEDNNRAGYYMIGKRNTLPPIEDEGMVYSITSPQDLGVRVTTITDGLTVRPVSKKTI